MPTAPNASALRTCSGVSALVRTVIRVPSAHHFISCTKFLNVRPFLASASFSTRPWMTSDAPVSMRPA